MRGTHLHLRVGPAGNLDNHVEDRLLLVGVERDVVPWRNELAVLLDEDAVLERVGRGHFADSVRHGVYALLGSRVNCCGGRRSGGVQMACKQTSPGIDFVAEGSGGAGRRGAVLGRRHREERHRRLSASRRKGKGVLQSGT
jgi:hypothetical protein